MTRKQLSKEADAGGGGRERAVLAVAPGRRADKDATEG